MFLGITLCEDNFSPLILFLLCGEGVTVKVPHILAAIVFFHFNGILRFRLRRWSLDLGEFEYI